MQLKTDRLASPLHCQCSWDESEREHAFLASLEVMVLQLEQQHDALSAAFNGVEISSCVLSVGANCKTGAPKDAVSM